MISALFGLYVFMRRQLQCFLHDWGSNNESKVSTTKHAFDQAVIAKIKRENVIISSWSRYNTYTKNIEELVDDEMPCTKTVRMDIYVNEWMKQIFDNDMIFKPLFCI